MGSKQMRRQPMRPRKAAPILFCALAAHIPAYKLGKEELYWVLSDYHK